MTGPDLARDSLSALSARLARGEIDEATFVRQRELVLSNLSAAERAELGVTPAPGPANNRSTPHRVSSVSFGPSGGVGQGLSTRIASLSDLDLRPGTILFDQWRIERELGRGGFGVVVEAEELTLRERQAVKVLDPAMVAREELLERFRREVKATRKLVHPRIVRVFDYRENLSEGLALFSMEHVKGCGVQSLLASARESGVAVPVPLALTVLAQVLEALDAAHRQGVIHRDVTPGNILLAGGSARELLASPARDPQVKLVDFGIAGALERSELSQKSRVLGTAAYVAPEVLDPRAEVTTAADVYGAGAVAYELLTGGAPLGRFEDPSRDRPEVGKEVDALVVSLLQRLPSARPSARAARETALDLLQGGPRRREAERQRQGRDIEDSAAREAAVREVAARARAEVRAEELAREAKGRAAKDGQESVRPLRSPPPIPRRPVAPPSPRSSPALAIGIVLLVVCAALVAAVLAVVWSSPGTAPTPDASSSPTPSALPAPARPAEVRPELTLRWVAVPAGSFTMGCTSGDAGCYEDEQPPHLVTLTTGFRMAATETTNAQYRACVEAGACATPAGRAVYDDPTKSDHPVVNVSWQDSGDFCRWVGGRLPTEAEWEYAARGGREGLRYPWGNEISPSHAKYGGSGTVPVDSYAPNRFGLYGMAGNAWEWCEDWFDVGYYGGSPSQDPSGPPLGPGRVLRGGAWKSSQAESLRVSHRGKSDPAARLGFYGFRCVRTASSP